MSKRTITISRTVLMLILFSMQVLTLNAQSTPTLKDLGYGGCGAHGRYTGASCPKCSSGAGSSSTYIGPNFWDLLNSGKVNKAAKAEQAHQKKLNDAYDTNNQGIEFQKKGDWVNAVAWYEKAALLSPDDMVIRDNLERARKVLDAQLADQRAQQQNKNATSYMQKVIDDFVKFSNISQASSGGLDFDGGTSVPNPKPTNTNTTTTATTELQFGDPNVVDARDEPSNTKTLAQATDNAINIAYKDAPAGVSDRIHKGFQAVQTKDWKVAKAWFQDALKLDPNNKGIQSFIALCDYTPEKLQQQTTATNPPKPDPYSTLSKTDQSEIDMFLKDLKEKRIYAPSDKVWNYLNSLSREDYRKRIDLQLPEDKDMKLLFNELLPSNLMLPTEEDIKILFPGNK